MTAPVRLRAIAVRAAFGVLAASFGFALGPVGSLAAECGAALASGGPDPTTDSLAYQKVADRIWPRSTIRVTPAGVGAAPLELRGFNVVPEGVRYTPAAGETPGRVRVGWSEIRSVDVKQHRTGTGALVGGAVLGGLSLLWGAALDSGEHTEANIPAIGLLGVLVGSGIGAGVGAMSSRWENIYTAPDSAQGGLASASVLPRVVAAKEGPASGQVVEEVPSPTAPRQLPAPRQSPLAFRFTTEFGGLYRAGPQVGRGAHVEDRWSAVWDFGPMIQTGDRTAFGLMGHISWTGSDGAKAGALLRVRRAVGARSSVDLAGGMILGEEGGALLMADWCYRDLLLPTVMVQFPPSDGQDPAPRIFFGAKTGSKAGLLFGTVVPIAAFMVVGLVFSSWDWQ